MQHSHLASCLPQLISPCPLQEINYQIQDYDPPPPPVEALDQPGRTQGNASRRNASGRAQVSSPGPGHDACVTLCDPYDDTLSSGLLSRLPCEAAVGGHTRRHLLPCICSEWLATPGIAFSGSGRQFTCLKRQPPSVQRRQRHVRPASASSMLTG